MHKFSYMFILEKIQIVSLKSPAKLPIKNCPIYLSTINLIILKNFITKQVDQFEFEIH